MSDKNKQIDCTEVNRLTQDLEYCLKNDAVGSAIGEEAYSQLNGWLNEVKPLSKKVGSLLVKYQQARPKADK